MNNYNKRAWVSLKFRLSCMEDSDPPQMNTYFKQIMILVKGMLLNCAHYVNEGVCNMELLLYYRNGFYQKKTTWQIKHRSLKFGFISRKNLEIKTLKFRSFFPVFSSPSIISVWVPLKWRNSLLYGHFKNGSSYRKPKPKHK